MKITRTGFAIIACFFWATVNGKSRSTELMNLISSAKHSDKCIIIKAFENEDNETSFDPISLLSDFFEMSIYASVPDDGFIIEKYGIEAFPSIVVLNPDGHLLLPAKKINSSEEIEAYAEAALSIKTEHNPLAQMDLEYRNNSMNIGRLFEYIEKRTELGMDNSEIIDKYTTVASKKHLLDEKILPLFIEQNSVNVPGTFCSFMQENQEQIKIMLRLSDERFNHIIDKFIESGFKNICRDRNEQALSQLIDVKTGFFTENQDIIYNEYMTRYFYETRQPLKLLNQARIFVDFIMKYRETHNSKTPLYSAVHGNYALKLVSAAQYIVETMSHKTALNDALNWIVVAEQLAHNNIHEIYETRAYIFYKLGNRENAITNIEKAYHLIDQHDVEQRKNLGLTLVKMKRGERIF